MTTTIAGVRVPDGPVAAAALELARRSAEDLLVAHSMRVFLFGSLRGRVRGLAADPELLLVAALFHDLGLTPAHRSSQQRFEIDGADAARAFLAERGVPVDAAETVWQAVALHTTPEVPWHMRPEVALLTAGVEVDVLGLAFDEVGDRAREEVVAAYPRPRFKRRIVDAFYGGIAHRPHTASGNVKADVLAHRDPAYRRPDFVDAIEGSAWPE